MLATVFLIIVNTIIWLTGLLVDLGSFSFLPASFHIKFYTIITSLFLHADIGHLMLNMLGLGMFGIILEKEIGKKKLVLTYLGAGICGNLTYLIFGGSSYIYALGASGSIFGIMGALAVLRPRLVVWTQFGPFPMIGAAAVWIVVEFFNSLGADNVSQSAHLGGIFFGILFGALVIANLDFKILSGVVVSLFFTAFIFSFSIAPLGVEGVPSDCHLEEAERAANFFLGRYSCGESSVFILATPSEKAAPESFSSDSYRFVNRYFKILTNKSCFLNSTAIKIEERVYIDEGEGCGIKFIYKGFYCPEGYIVRSVEYFNNLSINLNLSCGR